MSSTSVTARGQLRLPTTYKCPYCKSRGVAVVEKQYTASASRGGMVFRQSVLDDMHDRAALSLEGKMYEGQCEISDDVNQYGEYTVYSGTCYCSKCKRPQPWSGLGLNQRPVWRASILIGGIGALFQNSIYHAAIVFALAVCLAAVFMAVEVYSNAKLLTNLRSLPGEYLPYILNRQEVELLMKSNTIRLSSRSSIPNNAATIGKDAYIRKMTKEILKPSVAILFGFGFIMLLVFVAIHY